MRYPLWLLFVGALTMSACAGSTTEAGMTVISKEDAGDVGQAQADGLGSTSDTTDDTITDSAEPTSDTTDDTTTDSAEPTSDETSAGTEDTGEDEDESCLAAVICLTACDDDLACETACMAKADDHALARLQAAAPCFGGDDGGPPDAACLEKIMACIDPSGADACGDVLECVMGCDNDQGSMCMFGCLHDGTPAAAAEALDVVSCMNAADDGSMACLPDTLACINPSGALTCIELNSCMQQCGGDEDGEGQGPGCMIDCLEQGTPESAEQVMAASPCWGGNDDLPAEQCIEALVACFAPSGDGDCMAVSKCLQACVPAGGGGPEMECATACMTTSSKQGLWDFLTMSTCKDDCEKECGDTPDCAGPCAESKCPDAVAACSAPPAQ